MSHSVFQWLKSLLSAMCALVLSLLIISGIASFLKIFSDDFNGFDFSDVYMHVGDRRSVAELSNDVVIVSIDECSREGISHVIDAMKYLSPAAVGLDIFFLYSSAEGEELINSIKACNNIVLPIALDKEFFGSYFYDEIDAEYGVVNIMSSSSFDVVRDYVTLFNTDSTKYLSMPMALIQKSGKTQFQSSSDLKHIWYPSIDIEVIEADELVDEYGNPDFSYVDKIKGKIVLIGTVRDPSDMHRTPIKEEMPGTMIHGHIIDTILHNRHIRDIGMFWNILIAFIVSLLFIRLHLFLKDKLDDIGEILMRGIQLFLIYSFLIIGVNLYLKHSIFIDFSITMMMLFLCIAILNLINGVFFLWEKIRHC